MYYSAPCGAELQSGYATVCKTVYLGSIPGSASIFLKVVYNSILCPGGEIGRRKGLKIPRWQHRAGSIPALGTIIIEKSLLISRLFCVRN